MNTFTPFTQLTSSQVLDNAVSQNSSPTQPDLILDTPMSLNSSDSRYLEETQPLFSQYELTQPLPNEDTIRETPKDPRKRKAINAEVSAPKKKPAPNKPTRKLSYSLKKTRRTWLRNNNKYNLSQVMRR